MEFDTNMRKKLTLFLFVFMVSITTVLSGCTNTSQNTDNNSGTAENFTFELPNGTEMELKDYRGKIVILDMWATWCQPCQYQMLEFIKAYENYSDEIEILSINIDPSESNQDIIDFINLFANYGYHMNWVFGNEVDDTSKYKIEPDSGIPSICFFDRDGEILYKHVGVMMYDTFPAGWTGEKVLLKEKIDEYIK